MSELFQLPEIYPDQPCQGCGNNTGLATFCQPGCEEQDPAYLQHLSEQLYRAEHQCGVTIVMGKHDPYSATCEELEDDHPIASDVLTHRVVLVHRGDSWFGELIVSN